MQQHDLPHEFPEFVDLIAKLQASDTHFAELYAQYEDANEHVLRIEQNLEPASDFAFEDQKKKRLHLKDEIYAILRKAA